MVCVVCILHHWFSKSRLLILRLCYKALVFQTFEAITALLNLTIFDNPSLASNNLFWWGTVGQTAEGSIYTQKFKIHQQFRLKILNSILGLPACSSPTTTCVRVSASRTLPFPVLASFQFHTPGSRHSSCTFHVQTMFTGCSPS